MIFASFSSSSFSSGHALLGKQPRQGAFLRGFRFSCRRRSTKIGLPRAHARAPCPGLYRKPLDLVCLLLEEAAHDAAPVNGHGWFKADRRRPPGWTTPGGVDRASIFVLLAPRTFQRAVFFYAETAKTMNFVPLVFLTPLPVERERENLPLFDARILLCFRLFDSLTLFQFSLISGLCSRERKGREWLKIWRLPQLRRSGECQ